MLHGKLLVACALLGLAGMQPALVPDGAGQWTATPEYVRVFAPRAHADAYQTYVSPLDLATILRRLDGDPSLLRPPGSWTPSALLASEAFGQTGSYDRSKLARLYGARRAEVARGPRGAGGQPTQAWTLISPYPDTTFERLEAGTLLIVLNLEP